MACRRPIDVVRPTQLYLSAEKLASVLEWIDPAAPTTDPLPAFEYEGEWHLADGHTRAFAAWLCGTESLHIERDDTVRTDHDFDLYRTCIRWWGEEGIETVPDLAGRVLGSTAYEERWIKRCHRAAGNHSD